MASERKSETGDELETRSVVTRSTTSSKRSSRTSPSMAAAKARARAEAERTRAYYVKKETELKIESSYGRQSYRFRTRKGGCCCYG